MVFCMELNQSEPSIQPSTGRTNNTQTNSVFLCCQTHEDFKREHLDRIDNDLMQTKLVLVDITEPRRLCLQELGLRKNFVIWVKEALEGKWGDHLYLQEGNLSVISH